MIGVIKNHLRFNRDFLYLTDYFIMKLEVNNLFVIFFYSIVNKGDQVNKEIMGRIKNLSFLFLKQNIMFRVLKQAASLRLFF